MSGPDSEDGALQASMRRGDRPFLSLAVLVFGALTVLLFWRYAISPATAVSDAGDPLFLMWTMEWVGRTLVHSPRELFQAPMFYPFADALAYSDPLLPQSLIALPLRLVGFGPVAAYNAVYLGGIVTAGVVAALLFLRLTGDRVAALVGAVVATFPAIRLHHLAHMQLQVTVFLPLVLLLVHRLLRRPDAWSAAALGVTLAAATLASLYYGMLLALLLPPFALAAWSVLPRRSWAALGVLVAAAAAAGVLLLPFGRIYDRTIARLALERTERHFSDVLDYVGISSFADVGRLFPRLVVQGKSPQWIGASAGFLPPIAALGIASAAIRSRVLRGTYRLPRWAPVALPYSVLGCLALLLSLGPDLRWNGHVFSGSPMAYVFGLPGVSGMRDFQRAGFLVALAGGALVAVGLAELARRGRRRFAAWCAGFAALSTVVPAFSSSLPVYRPADAVPVGALEGWLERQPEPLILFEVPLPGRRDQDRLDYLWTSIQHKKRLIHGFSGYLPLTDSALRAETSGIGRPDFFRALGVLGATNLVVHTAALSALPGGPAAIAELREAHGGDRVAQFPDAEVYRVAAVAAVKFERPATALETPRASSGGSTDWRGRCVQIDPSSRPLVLFTPTGESVAGLHLVAEMPLGELDAAVLIERSDDLQTWRVQPHRPLLSEAISRYVDHPTPVFWTDILLPPGPGTFVRVSTRRQSGLRLCDLSIASRGPARAELVSSREWHLETHPEGDVSPLVDGDRSTRWQSRALQDGGEWIEIDLGREREILAVILDLGQTPYDYGRTLAVDCGDARGRFVAGPDLDGEQAVFERPHAEQVLPLTGPRACRVLRIRQTGHATENYWSVAELTVLVRSASAVAAGPWPG